DPSELGSDAAEQSGGTSIPNQRWPAGLGILCLLGLPLSIFFLTPNAIFAEIIDRDQAVRGGKREGIFFAAQAVGRHGGMALSAWVMNAVLTQGGDRVTLSGIQAVGPVAAVVVVIGVGILGMVNKQLGSD